MRRRRSPFRCSCCPAALAAARSASRCSLPPAARSQTSLLVERGGCGRSTRTFPEPSRSGPDLMADGAGGAGLRQRVGRGPRLPAATPCLHACSLPPLHACSLPPLHEPFSKSAAGLRCAAAAELPEITRDYPRLECRRSALRCCSSALSPRSRRGWASRTPQARHDRDYPRLPEVTRGYPR